MGGHGLVFTLVHHSYHCVPCIGGIVLVASWHRIVFCFISFCAVIKFPSSYRRFITLRFFRQSQSCFGFLPHFGMQPAVVRFLYLRAFSFSALCSLFGSLCLRQFSHYIRASRIASVSPAFTLSPSLTKNFRDTSRHLARYPVFCGFQPGLVWISGPFLNEESTMLTITITGYECKESQHEYCCVESFPYICIILKFPLICSNKVHSF